MATQANLRLLRYIELSPELRRSIPELPDAASREQAVSRNFLFPWTRLGRREKARVFLEDHLDSFVDFFGIPRIFFPTPARDKSLHEYQSSVFKALPKAKKTHFEAMINLRSSAVLAFGRPVELLRGGSFTLKPKKLFRNPLSLEDTHTAIVRLFEQQLDPSAEGKGSGNPLHRILNLPRAGSPRELEEINGAMVDELLKTGFGLELKSMVLSNNAIRFSHEREENRGATSTGYTPPKADYWRWPYGVSSPYRYSTLSGEDLKVARSLRSQMEPGSVSPWANLE